MATDYKATVEAVHAFVRRKALQIEQVKNKYNEVCELISSGVILDDVAVSSLSTELDSKKTSLEQWIENAASQAGVDLVEI